MRARLQKVVDVLFGDGGQHPPLRRAAAARAAAIAGGTVSATGASATGAALPAALDAWVDKVARTAWKITDEDVATLRAAGFDEDAIFETTIAAATGAALARYQTAMRALKR
jgi:alkylhydroperoxidase family enzyme